MANKRTYNTVRQTYVRSFMSLYAKFRSLGFRGSLRMSALKIGLLKSGTITTMLMLSILPISFTASSACRLHSAGAVLFARCTATSDRRCVVTQPSGACP